MDQAGSVKHSTPSERPTMAVRSRHFHDQSVASISFFFFQAEDGIRDVAVTVQTCALPISFRTFRSLRAVDRAPGNERKVRKASSSATANFKRFSVSSLSIQKSRE